MAETAAETLDRLEVARTAAIVRGHSKITVSNGDNVEYLTLEEINAAIGRLQQEVSRDVRTSTQRRPSVVRFYG